jgi:rhomboid protease GluP
MAFLLALAVIGAVLIKITPAEDRARHLATARVTIQEIVRTARQPRPELDAFRAALAARMRYLIVTPAIIAIDAFVMGMILFGPLRLHDPATLVQWGASAGLRTTNGEWWRLVTAIFVHVSLLHALVDMAVLYQLGAILERLVGRVAFAAVFLASGIFTGLINLSAHPIAVTVSATGGLFGLYGVLVAAIAWQQIRRLMDPEPEASDDDTTPRRLLIPRIAIKRVAICATPFVLYCAVAGFISMAELTGLLVGLGYGLIAARRSGDQVADTRPVLVVLSTMLAIAVTMALPLRNLADIQPEIAHVVATEASTAAVYKTAEQAFRKGRLNAEGLARVAERTIVPELQAADQRLVALKHVPPEHQPIVADAREYLHLRMDSWRARAEAVRRMNTELKRNPAQTDDPTWRLQLQTRYTKNLAAMGKAEGAERAALEAFRKIKPSDPAL